MFVCGKIFNTTEKEENRWFYLEIKVCLLEETENINDSLFDTNGTQMNNGMKRKWKWKVACCCGRLSCFFIFEESFEWTESQSTEVTVKRVCYKVTTLIRKMKTYLISFSFIHLSILHHCQGEAIKDVVCRQRWRNIRTILYHNNSLRSAINISITCRATHRQSLCLLARLAWHCMSMIDISNVWLGFEFKRTCCRTILVLISM